MKTKSDAPLITSMRNLLLMRAQLLSMQVDKLHDLETAYVQIQSKAILTDKEVEAKARIAKESKETVQKIFEANKKYNKAAEVYFGELNEIESTYNELKGIKDSEK